MNSDIVSDCLLLAGGTDCDDTIPWGVNQFSRIFSNNKIFGPKLSSNSFYESDCRYKIVTDLVNKSKKLTERIFCCRGGPNVICARLGSFKENWMDAAHHTMKMASHNICCFELLASSKTLLLIYENEITASSVFPLIISYNNVPVPLFLTSELTGVFYYISIPHLNRIPIKFALDSISDSLSNEGEIIYIKAKKVPDCEIYSQDNILFIFHAAKKTSIPAFILIGGLKIDLVVNKVFNSPTSCNHKFIPDSVPTSNSIPSTKEVLIKPQVSEVVDKVKQKTLNQELSENLKKIDHYLCSEASNKLANSKQPLDSKKSNNPKALQDQKKGEVPIKFATSEKTQDLKPLPESKKIESFKNIEDSKKGLESISVENAKIVGNSKKECVSTNVPEPIKVEESKKVEDSDKFDESKKIIDSNIDDDLKKAEVQKVSKKVRKANRLKKMNELPKILEDSKSIVALTNIENLDEMKNTIDLDEMGDSTNLNCTQNSKVLVNKPKIPDLKEKTMETILQKDTIISPISVPIDVQLFPKSPSHIGNINSDDKIQKIPLPDTLLPPKFPSLGDVSVIEIDSNNSNFPISKINFKALESESAVDCSLDESLCKPDSVKDQEPQPVVLSKKIQASPSPIESISLDQNNHLESSKIIDTNISSKTSNIKIESGILDKNINSQKNSIDQVTSHIQMDNGLGGSKPNTNYQNPLSDPISEENTSNPIIPSDSLKNQNFNTNQSPISIHNGVEQKERDQIQLDNNHNNSSKSMETTPVVSNSHNLSSPPNLNFSEPKQSLSTIDSKSEIVISGLPKSKNTSSTKKSCDKSPIYGENQTQDLADSTLNVITKHPSEKLVNQDSPKNTGSLTFKFTSNSSYSPCIESDKSTLDSDESKTTKDFNNKTMLKKNLLQIFKDEKIQTRNQENHSDIPLVSNKAQASNSNKEKIQPEDIKATISPVFTLSPKISQKEPYTGKFSFGLTPTTNNRVLSPRKYFGANIINSP
ncbi:hypothetical protein AYI68_g1943 [Smittium mucronatum]|uniref:Uncharacterized protein n=1 Tax=Smittium mucronatum TaxID=133383 RepID=A0A1R0H454_9FUNG|nr:hypothetical protein AYI68_g1943 [Smittium mucronatum]